jgi:hypothetical protein
MYTTIKKLYSNAIIFSIIQMTFVLVCVTLLGSLHSTFAQETTELKTSMSNYQDPLYGIQMQYPPDWTPSTSGIPAYNGVIGFYSPLKNLSDILPAEVTLSVTTYALPIPLVEYTQATLSALEQQDIKVEQSGSKTIAGKPGYSITFSPTSPNKGPYTEAPPQQTSPTFKVIQSWTAIDNKIYLLSFTAESSKFTNYLSTAEKMMNSLKVTPQ